MTIYIVTEGSYSDYHICAVFTDEQQAIRYCAAHDRYDECEIEVYEADEVKVDTEKEVKKKWFARFDFDGVLESVCEQGYCFDFQTEFKFNLRISCYWVTASLPLNTSKNKAERIFCDMFAKFKHQCIEEGVQPWEKASKKHWF